MDRLIPNFRRLRISAVWSFQHATCFLTTNKNQSAWQQQRHCKPQTVQGSGPAEPHLRTSGAHGAVLEEQCQDRSHGQAAVRDLSVEPALALLRVCDGAAAV